MSLSKSWKYVWEKLSYSARRKTKQIMIWQPLQLTKLVFVLFFVANWGEEKHQCSHQSYAWPLPVVQTTAKGDQCKGEWIWWGFFFSALYCECSKSQKVALVERDCSPVQLQEGGWLVLLPFPKSAKWTVYLFICSLCDLKLDFSGTTNAFVMVSRFVQSPLVLES